MRACLLLTFVAAIAPGVRADTGDDTGPDNGSLSQRDTADAEAGTLEVGAAEPEPVGCGCASVTFGQAAAGGLAWATLWVVARRREASTDGATHG